MFIAAKNTGSLTKIGRSDAVYRSCRQGGNREVQKSAGRYSDLFYRLFCWSLLLCSLSPVIANAQEAVPWRGERGITESVRDIMAREHAQGARSPQASRVPPRGRIPGKLADKSGLSTAPESQIPEFAESTIAGGSVSAAFTIDTPLVFNAQSSGTNFLGPVYANSGFLPPDSMGAVGPSQIVVGVNGRIRTYNKSGIVDFNLDTTMDNFFTSVRFSSTTSDP